MRVNIICSRKNFSGLQQDAKILHGMISAVMGKETQIRHVPHFQPHCLEADVNFFLEVMNPAMFVFAAKNIWLPNPEWTYQTWAPYARMVDEIWVKTHDAVKLFEAITTKPIHYISWTSIDKVTDRILPTKKWDQAICPTGTNIWRNPKPLVQAYMWIQAQDPALYAKLPHVHLVCRVHLPPLPATVADKFTLHADVLEEETYNNLLSTSGLCVCLSAAEGFCHAVNEAMSTGSSCILSPIQPFRELTQHAMWVSNARAIPHPECLGVLEDIDIASLADALGVYVQQSEDALEKTATEMREEYEARHDAFLHTITPHIERMIVTEPFALVLPKEEELPKVSIVTITRDRRQFIPLAKYLFLAQSYPQEKMEWVIVDDGTDQIKDLVSDLPNVKYILVDQALTIGEKRNLAIQMAEHDVVVMMDDDDIYPKNSVLTRVAYLMAEPKRECVFTTTIPCYQIHEKKSFMNVPPMTLTMAKRVSEATIACTRAFWEKQKFPDQQIAEGDAFIHGREEMCREIFPNDVIVSLIHKKNTSSRKPPAMETNGCHYGLSDELFTLVTEIADSL